MNYLFRFNILTAYESKAGRGVCREFMQNKKTSGLSILSRMLIAPYLPRIPEKRFQVSGEAAPVAQG